MNSKGIICQFAGLVILTLTNAVLWADPNCSKQTGVYNTIPEHIGTRSGCEGEGGECYWRECVEAVDESQGSPGNYVDQCYGYGNCIGS